MIPNGTTDTQIRTHDSKWGHLFLILLGGLLIGLAASLPLAVVWPYPTPPPESFCVYGGKLIRLGAIIFPLHCPPSFMFVQPLVWGSFFTAGGLSASLRTSSLVGDHETW